MKKLLLTFALLGSLTAFGASPKITAQNFIDKLQSAFNKGELQGITTDSRAVKRGEVFVALMGGKFDGHDFIDAAVDQGAAAIVVSKPPVKDHGVAIFRVPDTLAALGQLANAWRRA